MDLTGRLVLAVLKLPVPLTISFYICECRRWDLQLLSRFREVITWLLWLTLTYLK
jgi:hypothetical protein